MSATADRPVYLPCPRCEIRIRKRDFPTHYERDCPDIEP